MGLRMCLHFCFSFQKTSIHLLRDCISRSFYLFTTYTSLYTARLKEGVEQTTVRYVLHLSTPFSTTCLNS